MSDNTVVETPEVSENSSPEQTETTAPANTKVNLSTFYGVKAGMTRIFNEQGQHVPVTVIKLVPNFISQVKTIEKDGYEAYQVAYFPKKETLVNNPSHCHLKKAGLTPNLARYAEVRATGVDADAVGKEVSFEDFATDTYIDVSGTSKGKGFQGVIKRYGFKGGPASHGSHFHRAPGSIGQCAYPGRVFPGKKMPGQMGNKKRTVQNLKVVELNPEKGYLLIKGSIPGSKNSFVKISKSIKKA